MITQERLKELLTYDKETGKFIWVKPSSKYHKVSHGTEAGSIDKHGYRRIWIDNVAYKAQHLAVLYETALMPTTTVVLIDGNKANTSFKNIGLLHDFQNFVLTQDELKKVLHYNPTTGEFTRLVHFSSSALKGTIAGGLTKAGYLLIAIGKQREYAHRLAFLYMTGSMPEYVDHKDHNTANNAWNNLRACTHSENMQNQIIRVSNKTGVKGVYYDKRKSVFVARLTTNGIKKWIGSFKTLKEAEQAVKLYRQELHREFTHHG